MDGMQHIVGRNVRSHSDAVVTQRTLKTSIACVGVGLHSGKRVNMHLYPAPIDHGIVFRRTDLGRDIPARFDRVVDTRLCTVLAGDDTAARIGTVEHILAALAGLGIGNVLIELDGPEVPILDGSAREFLFLLECAGLVDQDEARRVIEVRRTVRVGDVNAWAELRPLAGAPAPTLHMDIAIDFTAAAIGRQSASISLTPTSFRQELAGARTFAMMAEVEQMQAAGLALGGSLDNAIVVDDDHILNPGGLRMEAEFARHKLLDAVGDLALAGAALHGVFTAYRSGHALNNQLLRALLADPTAWRLLDAAPIAVAA